MMAGSPSGIAATATPTAARNISVGAKSRTATPNRKVKAEAAIMTPVSQRAKTAICRRSGVVKGSTRAIKVPMRPISVVAPVAVTTPRPSPWVTSVPE